MNDSSRYLGTDLLNLSSPVPGETRQYTFDPIGNRTTITEGTSAGTYTVNNLNQYTASTLPANSYTNDEDGNLTQIVGNKNITYTYDGENRLITAEPTTPILSDKKLNFLYDYQGRRVQKVISNYNGTAWITEATKNFIYDGWNVIEEQTLAQPSKYYVWGLDLSQSLQGAGGVGGLLTQVESANSYAYLMDGNGNVGQMVNNSTGVIEAHYEYDPFGNAITATGALANSNPYRFSTKYLDSEYNLYYYGHRYYVPESGRWLNRDPAGEQLGFVDRMDDISNFNLLYGFVANDPINGFDLLGLYTLNDAKNKIVDSRCGHLPGRARSRCGDQVRGRLTDQKVFDAWFALEESRGPWWANENLPKCPRKLCTSNVEENNAKLQNPDSSKWKNPDRPSNPERLLHPGTKWSMRSKTVSGHSNQCTYDEGGNLLPCPAGAGTVDWKSPSITSTAHFNHDVDPAILAANLDGNRKTLFSGTISIVGENVLKYYKVRPLWAEEE